MLTPFNHASDCISTILDKSADAKVKHLLRLADSKKPQQDPLEFKKLHESVASKNSQLASIDDSFKARVNNSIIGIVLMVPFILLVTLAINH